MLSPKQAAEALRDSARALHDALVDQDDEATAAALERREAALAGLEAAVRGNAGGLDAIAALVSEVRRVDAQALALAKEKLDGVRVELDQVGRARGVARSLAAEQRPARFVSKRV